MFVRWAISASNPSQTKPHQYRRGGSKRGTSALEEGQLQCGGQSQHPPVEPHGQHSQQPQQSWDPWPPQRHQCNNGKQAQEIMYILLQEILIIVLIVKEFINDCSQILS